MGPLNLAAAPPFLTRAACLRIGGNCTEGICRGDNDILRPLEMSGFSVPTHEAVSSFLKELTSSEPLQCNPTAPIGKYFELADAYLDKGLEAGKAALIDFEQKRVAFTHFLEFVSVVAFSLFACAGYWFQSCAADKVASRCRPTSLCIRCPSIQPTMHRRKKPRR